jgi:hypothetical protein
MPPDACPLLLLPVYAHAHALRRAWREERSTDVRDATTVSDAGVQPCCVRVCDM